MKVPLLLLIVIIAACGKTKKSPYSEQQIIFADSVRWIHIKKSSLDKDSVLLTDEQSKEFVNKWNHAQTVGPYKFMPQYWITITLADGSIRKFRSFKDMIKEKNDWAFSVNDSVFIENCYKATNP